MKTSMSSTARSKTSSTTHHAVAGDPRVQSNTSNDYFHKLHSPSSHSSSTSQHQSSRQQSHHHSILSSHHSDQSSQSHQVPLRQHSNQSSQHHLSMPSAPQVMQQNDFPSPLMMGNYPPPSTHAGGITSSSNLRSNLITVQIHDSNVDSVNNSIGIPLAAGFPHQNFSPQFPQTTSSIPFPVPPPGQLPTLAQISQSHPQFFSTSPANYTAPSLVTSNTYVSNPSTQPIMTQSMMQNRAPPMVPPPRRNQFPGEAVIQPFPVPPPHRWHAPPNQTHFY